MEVLRFWLDLGVDGFRLDVVNYHVKDAQWRSNPLALSLPPPDRQRHVYDRNRPETHEHLREIRKRVDSYGDRSTVGEVCVNDAAAAAANHGAQGDELHPAFNFAFPFWPWSAAAFWARVEEWERLLPPGA